MCDTIPTELMSLSQNEKVTFEDSDAKTTKKDSVQYQKRCSMGNLYSAKWLKF